MTWIVEMLGADGQWTLRYRDMTQDVARWFARDLRAHGTPARIRMEPT